MKAPEFELVGVDGKRCGPVTARGDNGLLVMFICNHCPYVKAVLDRIVRDCKELAPHGIGSVAVMPNDPADYPEDSFDNMRRVAAEKRLDASRRDPLPNARRELFEAMVQIAETGVGPKEQFPSIGCSIKWKK